MDAGKGQAMTSREPTHCCIHLPGNRQCPYPPLYVVGWKPHRLKPTDRIFRRVCLHHLARAIDDALEDSPRDCEVTVQLWDL